MIALALALLGSAPVAQKFLYRDPVNDGAADASTTYDPKTREWVMLYTNRSANVPLADEKDVRWVHGTAIGMARSNDGARWRYTGTAAIPNACTGETLRAPEVQRIKGRWHMWVTVVPGIFRDWNHLRFIQHLTSKHLTHWTCADRLDLGSDRVIDASVLPLPTGGYRLCFNDERRNKAIRYADSPDLTRWTVRDTIVDTPGERPKAFRWQNRWWLISYAWKGLPVLRSDDGERWTRQPRHIPGHPGTAPIDRGKGQHPM